MFSISFNCLVLLCFVKYPSITLSYFVSSVLIFTVLNFISTNLILLLVYVSNHLFLILLSLYDILNFLGTMKLLSVGVFILYFLP